MDSLANESFVASFNSTDAAVDALNEALHAQQASTSVALNTIWLLVCAALVFFMQAGFAMLEAGAVQRKNSRSILLKNILDAGVGICLYYFLGWGFAYGSSVSNAFIGAGSFALDGVAVVDYSSWFFQAAFAVTSVTIVSGAIAERADFRAYLLFAICMCGFVYPVTSHWVWGGGWLAAGVADDGQGCGEGALFCWGAIDFAGSSVVHLLGGMSALVAAKILGQRNQYSSNARAFPPRFESVYDEEAGKTSWRVNTLHAASISLQCMGCLILWFGWFGFNAGSTLALDGEGAAAAAAVAAANTAIAPAGATITATAIGRALSKSKQYSINDTINGVLGGLVAITAGCSVVEAWAALFIGVLGGCVFKFASIAVERARIDDPLDAFAVHGACGIFGTVMVGFLASPRLVEVAYGAPAASAGLFYSGRFERLGAQIVCALVISLWSAFFAAIIFGTLHRFNLFRLSVAQEEAGIGVALNLFDASAGTQLAAMSSHNKHLDDGSQSSSAAHVQRDNFSDDLEDLHPTHSSSGSQAASAAAAAAKAAAADAASAAAASRSQGGAASGGGGGGARVEPLPESVRALAAALGDDDDVPALIRTLRELNAREARKRAEKQEKEDKKKSRTKTKSPSKKASSSAAAAAAKKSKGDDKRSGEKKEAKKDK